MKTNDADDAARDSWKKQLFRALQRPIYYGCGLLLTLFPQNRRLLAMLSRKPAEQRPANVTFVDWRDASTKEAAESLRRRRFIGRSVAAAALVIVPGSLVAFRMNFSAPSATSASATPDGPVATEINDAQRTQQLDDGSVVSCDARSRLLVDFTDKRRDVHVIVGKAMFNVAEDKAARPFRAATLLVYATADAGTNFSVEVGRNVFVQVHQGLVQLSRRGAKAGTPVMTLKTGESAHVQADELVAMVPGSGAESIDG